MDTSTISPVNARDFSSPCQALAPQTRALARMPMVAAAAAAAIVVAIMEAAAVTPLPVQAWQMGKKQLIVLPITRRSYVCPIGFMNNRPNAFYSKHGSRSNLVNTPLPHYCRVCNIQLNSCRQAKIHSSGKKHHKRLQCIQQCWEKSRKFFCVLGTDNRW